jgi:hypothetical protein
MRVNSKAYVKYVKDSAGDGKPPNDRGGSTSESPENDGEGSKQDDGEYQLVKEQQAILSISRDGFVKAVEERSNERDEKAKEEKENEVNLLFEEISNKVHIGSWKELEPTMSALCDLPNCKNSTFILAGWFTSTPQEGGDTPQQLLQLLDKCNVYNRAIRLAAAASTEKDLGPFMQQHREDFPKQNEAALLTSKEILKMKADVERRITMALLFDKNRAFLFTSQGGKSGGGRGDFWRFVRGYNAFTEVSKYEPYQFIVINKNVVG